MFKEFTDFLRMVVGYDLPVPPLQEIIIALALSFALNCLIAAVYKNTYRGNDYSQDYVHALIILGTVVSVVIMVVRGDAGIGKSALLDHLVEKVVGWHQDAYYWPMTPHNSVTVWLAYTDVDEENGAMQIVPGPGLQQVILSHHRWSAELT